MKYRLFGRTAINTSTISMGTNRLGDPGEDPAQWPPIVERAIELGINFFDTAHMYNEGRSEEVLGNVMAGRSEPIYFNTKTGMAGPDDDKSVRPFSGALILAQVENSLRRLKRDYLDMYLLHSPNVGQLESEDWAETFAKLRQQGKIRWYGISTRDHASGITAIRMGADILQVEYDMLFPTAEDELLPLAIKHHVGVMVRTPLARGLLTGKFAPGQPLPPEQQWRRPKGDQLQLRLARIEQLRFLERPGQTMAEAALRFVLAHSGVHCAVPGARTVVQLEANVRAGDAELTPEELKRIQALHSTWRAEGKW